MHIFNSLFSLICLLKRVRCGYNKSSSQKQGLPGPSHPGERPEVESASWLQARVL